jgi:hypothetical protein
MKAQLSLCLIKYHATKAHEEVVVQLQSFPLVSFTYQLHYQEEYIPLVKNDFRKSSGKGGGFCGFPNLISADNKVCTIVNCTQFEHSECKAKHDINKDRLN